MQIVTLLSLTASTIYALPQVVGTQNLCPAGYDPIYRLVGGSYGGVKGCNNERGQNEAVLQCKSEFDKVTQQFLNVKNVQNAGISDGQYSDSHWKEGTFRNVRKCSGKFSAVCNICVSQ